MQQKQLEEIRKLKEWLRDFMAGYDKAILYALDIDDATFFKLPYWRREKYVQLTKGYAGSLGIVDSLLHNLPIPLYIDTGELMDEEIHYIPLSKNKFQFAYNVDKASRAKFVSIGEITKEADK